MFTVILGAISAMFASPMALPIAQFLLAIVGYFIQKGFGNAEARQRFLSIVQQAEAAGSIPAGLYAKYSGLLKSVDDKIDAELAKEAKEHPPAS